MPRCINAKKYRKIKSDIFRATTCDHYKPPPLTLDLIQMAIGGENASERKIDFET